MPLLKIIKLHHQEPVDMAVKITCIKKVSSMHENPYVAIETMGWFNETTGNRGHTTREMMYDYIMEGGTAYVGHGVGHQALLEAVLGPDGTKYVKTKVSLVVADLLLRLPECS